MKKQIKFLIILLLIISRELISQNQQIQQRIQPFTANGIFDTVFDRFGKKFALRDLQINPNGSGVTGQGGKLIGSGQTINSVPTLSCSSGYFNLYFTSGSCFDGTGAQATAMRNDICQLFSDISGFIVSTLPSTVKINILCGNTSNPFALGVASSYNVLPLFPLNPNQGIIDNQIQKALISGKDPFANLAISAFPGANNFYYGYIEANPTPPLGGWYLPINSTAIAPNQFDFYTVMLHEVTHALGFASYIGANGISRMGAAHNLFTRYDKFLYDSFGNPLLGSSNPPCNNSYLTFQGPATAIAPGNCVNTGPNSDITACNTAAQYIGSTNVKVYTPNCYEDGSSLSHFEDICTTPPGFATSCVASPPNNNLYYVMSNAQSPGSCYLKRHLTPEERLVLCDLGYQVNSTYASPVAGANFIYPGTTCPGTNVWAVNDGLNGTSIATAYITTMNTPTSIPIGTRILNNDSPFATGIACWEEIYGNASSVVTSGPGLPGNPSQNLVVTPSPGYTGLILIKYLPKNANGEFGNAAFIYVYVNPGNCSPPNVCDMIQNPGFESLAPTSLQDCGWIDWSPFPPMQAVTMNCWGLVEGTPDLFTRNGTSHPLFNLGTNTYNFPTPMNTFMNPLPPNPPGTTNDRVLGLSSSSRPNFVGTEVIKNSLGSPLVPNTNYQISFWANNYSGPFNVGMPDVFNPNARPIIVTIASAPNYAILGANNYPSSPGIDIITEFTVPANGWQHYQTNFTFNPQVLANHGALLIGINLAKTSLSAPSVPVYCFFDEVSLVSLPSPTFAITQSTMCTSNSIINLAQYASPVPGTFYGTGVTFSGGQYHFNLAQNLTPGNYPIAFTYTLSNGCIKTLWANILIKNGAPLFVSTGGAVSLCPGNTVPVPLTAIANPAPNPTYNWQPGNIPGQNISVNPPSTTIYTVTASAPGYCQANATVLVSILPSLTVTAGNATLCTNAANSVLISANASGPGPITYNWQPGNLFGQNQSVSPASNTIYQVNVSSPNACGSSATLAVSITTNCCSQPTTGLIPLTSLTGVLSNNSYLINNNISVSGGLANLMNSEFLIMPGVQITVPSGQIFNISHSHLYACGINMWQGIVIQDGAQLTSLNQSIGSTLIEDALVAMDIDGISPSHINPPIDLMEVIFNKNYVGIKVSNATNTIPSIPLKINSCVFTSRTFTYSSPAPFSITSWPNADATTSGLRFASNPGTSLVSPFNLQFNAFSNLKAPYANQPGHIGILIDNVCNQAGAASTPGVDIGVTFATATNWYNLFDGLGEGIDIKNGSLTTMNNVFQNMKYYATSTGNFGGMGINQTITSLMNARLDLRPVGASNQNTTMANRFWDCYVGILTNNVYDVDIEYNLFRSTRNPFTGWGPGTDGVVMTSNRFDYNIRFCEFNNIRWNLWCSATSGAYQINNINTTGTYAGNIQINQNYIGAEVASNINNPLIPGTESSNFAITLNGTSGSNWNMAGGCKILSNKIDRVYRGIRVNGMEDYPVEIGGNNIKIIDDYQINIGADQYGIYVNDSKDNLVINHNTVRGDGYPFNGWNQNLKLIRSSFNKSISNMPSPIITCNEVYDGYVGFEFEGLQLNTVWNNNIMFQKMAIGLSMVFNGGFGVQGSPALSSGNSWNDNGNFTPPDMWSINWQTFVDATSNAANSFIWGSSPPFFLPMTNGFIMPGTDFQMGPSLDLSNLGAECTTPNTYPTPPSQRSTSPYLNAISENENKSDEWQFTVFPNPSNSNITIQSNIDKEALELRIMDVNGRVVLHKVIDKENNVVNVSSLNAALYFIEVKNSNNQVLRKKFIKVD